MIASRFTCQGASRRSLGFSAVLALLSATAPASGAAAADTLIRNATVHTADVGGKLERSDVRISGGRIAEIGQGLSAGANVMVVDAAGRALTPGLFGGVTAIGLDEVSAEATTVDEAYTPGKQTPPAPVLLRPEFDVMPAFNAQSVLIPVNRMEGITFAMVAPVGMAGGSFVPGQGAAITLDGRWDAELAGSRTLFIQVGADAAPLSGNSRAAQWMLLEQAVREARAATPWAEGDERLLSAAGRSAFARYLAAGRVAFSVDRAADIRQVLAFSKAHGLRPVIIGGAQAPLVAAELAAAKAAVLLDPFLNLPGGFDQLGVGLDNAARLHAAGVRIAFVGDAGHNTRKLRQGAGIAVANGLPWDAALAALTANPAAVFGLGAQRGRIAVGLAADLVLWSGDPLEVTSLADQVWIEGRSMPLRSRQTDLRDRYLSAKPALPRAYPGR